MTIIFDQCAHLCSPQLCTTMCTSSITINNTNSIFDESVDWFCMCEGHFGPYATFITSILCFTVGSPIHCWSLWVYLRGNIKPNLVFPLNFTVLELFFCIQCIIDIIVISYPSLHGAHLANFLIGVSWTVRPLLQICMCVEKYLAVIHPIIFLRYKGIQYRITLAAAVWLISFGNGLRGVLSGTNYFKDHAFFLIFCIAVIITSFCCASVLWALKRPGPGNRNDVEMTKSDAKRGKTPENQQKKKAFSIISHILVSILICYLPLVVIYFINIAKISKYLYLCEIVPLTLSISVTAVFFSPLVRMYSEGNLKLIMCFSNK